MHNSIQRTFVIGDQWLYYKIYAGPKTCDLILTEIIRPITDQLTKENVIDQWFFIRYADPKHHIRVRLHYIKPNDISVVINKFQPLFQDYIDEDLIWRIQTDTYQREIERYGQNTMELSEMLFYHDSKMILDFLSLIEGEQGEEIRWLFSLKAIDTFLDSFKYDETQKLNLLNTLKIGYRTEFDTSKVLGKQLNDKFRIERRNIEAFMDLDENSPPDYIPLVNLLEQKRRRNASTIEKILHIQNIGELQVDINYLLESYIHMLMNRIFKSQNRLHEMVCYDFLTRYYRSQIARRNVS